MPLFGSNRDVDLVRKLNRELMGEIINQQCALYLVKNEETPSNIYGEASQGYNFEGPYIFNVLIDRTDTDYPDNNGVIGVTQNIDFHFFKDDLIKAEVIPNVGDYVLYEEKYYLINDIDENQRFVGKHPDYPNNPNPLMSGLDKFGTSISITCRTNIVPSDRVGITRERNY